MRRNFQVYKRNYPVKLLFSRIFLQEVEKHTEILDGNPHIEKSVVNIN